VPGAAHSTHLPLRPGEHGSTFGGNPVACAAGRAVLRVIEQEGLQQNAVRIGAEMLSVVQGLQQRYDIIGDVRGRGLMVAMEMVKDRKTREPATELTAEIYEATRENGLIMSKSGVYKNVMRIVPPMCINHDDVTRFADAIDRSFQSVFSS